MWYFGHNPESPSLCLVDDRIGGLLRRGYLALDPTIS
jgi:hypothetical protein